jgi:hypothetical protein
VQDFGTVANYLPVQVRKVKWTRGETFLSPPPPGGQNIRHNHFCKLQMGVVKYDGGEKSNNNICSLLCICATGEGKKNMRFHFFHFHKEGTLFSYNYRPVVSFV